MKFLKILLKLFLGLFILFIVALGIFLFVPGVQAAVVRPFIPADPDITPRLEHLKLSLNGAEARGFSTRLSNVAIDFDSATMQIPWWGLVSQGEAHVQSLHLTGLNVDVSQLEMREPEVEKESEPFGGFLSSFKWPEALIVDEVQIDGDVIMKEGQSAKLTVEGKNMGIGLSGSLDTTVQYDNITPLAPLTQANIQGGVQWRINQQGFFENLRGTQEIKLALPASESPVQLSLQMEAEAIEGGDRVKVALGSPDLPSGAPTLLTLESRYLFAEERLVGEFTLALRSEDWVDRLGAEYANLVLQANGSGNFSLFPQTMSGTLETVGEFSSTGLDQVLPAIPVAFSNVQGGWNIQLTSDSEIVRVGALELDLSLPGTPTRITLRPESELAIPLTGPADGETALPLAPVILTIEGITPSLISEFVPENLQVGFESFGGELRIVPESLTQFAITSREPLVLNQLIVRGDGIPALTPLRLTLQPNIQYSPDAIDVRWELKTTAPESSDSMGILADWYGSLSKRDNVYELRESNLTATLTEARHQVPGLPAGMAIQFSSLAALEASLLEDGLHTTLDQFSLRVGTGNQNWFTLTSGESIRIPPMGEDFMNNLENASLSLEVDQFPLALAGSFVEGLEISGNLTQGHVALGAQQQVFTLDTRVPLSANNLSLTWQGNEMLRDVDIALNPSGTLDGEKKLQFLLRESVVSTSVGQILRLTSDVEADLAADVIPWTFTAETEANLELARQQPALREFLENVMQGEAKIFLRGRYLRGLEAEGKADLVNLQGKGQAEALTLSAPFTIEHENDSGVTSWKTPISLKSGPRTSAVELTGNLTMPSESRSKGNARVEVTGEIVHLQDFMALSTALTPSSEPVATTRPGTQPPPAPRSTVPDTEPVWAGWDADVSLNLNKLVLQPGNTLDQVKGSGTVRNDRAALESFTALLNGAPTSAQAQIKFHAGRPQPYQLEGGFRVQNLETAPFFANVARPPINARFQGQGSFQGTGANLGHLADQIQGRAQLESGPGIFRAFAGMPMADLLASGTGQAAQLLFSLAGDKLPPELRALERLTSILAEIPFQQFRMEVVRGADLNLVFRDMRLVGNEIQLTGQGNVAYQEGKTLLEQPLNMTFNMPTRGPTAEVFQAAKIIAPLAQDANAQAFRNIPYPFEIGGSLGNVSADKIWTDLFGVVSKSLNLNIPGLGRRGSETEGGETKKDPVPDIIDGIFREIFR